MAIKVTLKNSVVQDSVPTTSHLAAVGELALNANINSLGIYMRASDNSIVKMAGPGSVTTPAASVTVAGIAELATSAETTTGTDAARVTTPAGVKAVTDAERTTSNNTYLAKAGGTLTGVVAATAGSNSAPAIHFGDSDSGLFGGTNTVSLTAGGTTRLTADTGVSVVGTLAVTGAITSTSDLTIADKIIHAGDTNTAIRFPAADTVSVETGGSERTRVDSSGRLLVGTSSTRSIWGANTKVQLESTDSSSSFSLIRNQANNDGPWIALCKSRGASNGSNTIVQDGDSLGSINWFGSDGVDLNNTSAEIRAEIDGTPGSDDVPGKLLFKTTADGAASPTTRLTITSAGLVNVPDNGKFSVGSSNDALLWHNGTHTYFQNSTGNIVLQAKSGEDSIVATPDAGVSLYYDTSKKFETNNTGARIEGALILGRADSGGEGGEIKFNRASDDALQWTNDVNGTDATATLRWFTGGSVKLNLNTDGDLSLPNDNAELRIGAGDDLKLFHNATNSFIQNATAELKIQSSETHIVNQDNSEFIAKFRENNAVELYYDGSKRFDTTSAGVLAQTSNASTTESNADTLIVRNTNDGASTYAGIRLEASSVASTDFYIAAKKHSSGNGTHLHIGQGSTERLQITESGSVLIPDNGKFAAGTGSDLQIYHDSNHTYIDNHTGQLKIRNAAAGNILIQARDDDDGIIVKPDGAVELFWDHGKKFETLTNGVKTTGSEFITEGTIYLEKSGVHHHRIIINDTGNDLAFQQSSDSGANTNFTTYLRIDDGGDISLPVDGKKLLIGAGDDLQIYHNGSDSYIDETGAGDLKIRSSSGIQLQNGTDKYIACIPAGETQLYYDGSEKLNTRAGGIEVNDGASGSSGITAIVKLNGSSNTTNDGTELVFQRAGSNTGRIQCQKVLDNNTTDLIFHTRRSNTVSESVRMTGYGLKVTGNSNDPASANWDTNSSIITGGTYGGGIAIVDGSAGFVQYCDNFGGNWKLKSGSTTATPASNIEATHGSGVYIFFDNSEKFRTVTDGCKVTGKLDVSSNLYVEGTGEFNMIDQGNKYIDTAHLNHYIYFRRINDGDTNHAVHCTVSSAGLWTADFNDTSDEKLKENINTISDGAINHVKQLRPVTFDWKDPTRENNVSGFVAQEIKTVLPNLVYGTEYDPTIIDDSQGIKSSGYSVNTIGVVAHLTKALQEAIAKIETLETKVAALEGA